VLAFAALELARYPKLTTGIDRGQTGLPTMFAETLLWLRRLNSAAPIGRVEGEGESVRFVFERGHWQADD
jgi:hypothetical protein